MKIGAWYDGRANELHLRLRGATTNESRQTLRALGAILQTVPFPELRAMGQAIHLTLAEEGDETNRVCQGIAQYQDLHESVIHLRQPVQAMPAGEQVR